MSALPQPQPTLTGQANTAQLRFIELLVDAAFDKARRDLSNESK